MWLNKYGIFIIIGLSFIFRAISLNQSLWWDEAINVVYARQNDFWWFVTKYPLGDFHPPGWFAILWVWGNIFGWSEISVRFPSVIFGVTTVFLTYLIGKELFSKKIGILSAFMMSFAPLHIYYSQEARMYAFSAFAVSFSIYSLILLINRKRFGQLFFIFSTVLILFSDYVAYFIFPVQFIYLLFFEKEIIKIYLSSFFFSLIFFIPWILILPEQIIIGQKMAILIPAWKDVVGGNSIKELIIFPVKVLAGRISFDNNFLYYGFVSIVAIPYLFIFLKIRKAFDKKYSLILLWLLFTPILVWSFSYFLPIFSYFRLLYILPAFYIAVAVCLNIFSFRLFLILIMFIISFELLISCLYLFNTNFQREDWRSAINFVLQNQNNQKLIIFKNREIPAPAKYYSSNLSSFQPGLANDLVNNLVYINDVFLFEYLGDVYDPEKKVEQVLKSLNFKENKIYDFQGVGFVRLYTR